MWWLYSLLLLLSFVVPFLLSFEKKLLFRSKWKYLLPSILAVAVVYIAFDIIFTRKGIWGFNPEYHSGLTLWGLPLEELLFFAVIPYASIFLHEALLFHFPGLNTGKRFSRMLSAILIISAALLIFFHSGKAYTVYSCSLLMLSLIAGLSDRSGVLRRFFVTFVVILIPFLVVNGILTGSLIDEEVVWYNPEEILGLRILTIPLEDVGYGFSLILFDLLLAEKLKRVFVPAKMKAR